MIGTQTTYPPILEWLECVPRLANYSQLSQLYILKKLTNQFRLISSSPTLCGRVRWVVLFYSNPWIINQEVSRHQTWHHCKELSALRREYKGELRFSLSRQYFLFIFEVYIWLHGLLVINLNSCIWHMIC